ncbi:penicillin-binding transpeptidase domain-containing protein [Streptomyces lydicus]|uniref:penicillin-binding transpeptidase domain-containing protein n=1 Tax=Streptomyces lydicus TaxID=47763 RepID=UPI0033F78154
MALLAPFLSGCSTQRDAAAPVAPSDKKQSVPKPPKAGLGNIIVAGRAVTGSKPSGTPKVPYRRTYTDGELYASVTGIRSMAFGRNGLEAIYDDVLGAGPGHPGHGPGNVVTAIAPAVQRAAADGLRGRKGAAVALDAATGHIRALVSTPSYDPATFSGNLSKDAEAWQKLNDDEDTPLVNRTIRDAVPTGDAFHVVVAAAALDKGIYASVDDRTHSPVTYRLPGSTTEVTGDRAHCKDASIRSALRYACANVFARMAAEVGRKNLVATAEAFGSNDDDLFAPVRVVRSTFPRDDASAAYLALRGNGQEGATATPLEMARVMAVIASGGRQIHPQLVTQVVRADGSMQRPKYSGVAGARVIRQETAAQLRSALKTSGPSSLMGGTTGWALPTGGGAPKEAAAWSIAFTRAGDGRPMAIAVCAASPGSPSDRSRDVKMVKRIAEAMGLSAAKGTAS